jgi:hypothetical protein
MVGTSFFGIAFDGNVTLGLPVIGDRFVLPVPAAAAFPEARRYVIAQEGYASELETPVSRALTTFAERESSSKPEDEDPVMLNTGITVEEFVYAFGDLYRRALDDPSSTFVSELTPTMHSDRNAKYKHWGGRMFGKAVTVYTSNVATHAAAAIDVDTKVDSRYLDDIVISIRANFSRDEVRGMLVLFRVASGTIRIVGNPGTTQRDWRLPLAISYVVAMKSISDGVAVDPTLVSRAIEKVWGANAEQVVATWDYILTLYPSVGPVLRGDDVGRAECVSEQGSFEADSSCGAFEGIVRIGRREFNFASDVEIPARDFQESLDALSTAHTSFAGL